MADRGMVKQMSSCESRDSRRVTRAAWDASVFFLGLLLCFRAPGLRAQALVQNRISAPIRSDQMQVIKGTVHPLVAMAQDEGQLSGSTPIQGMSLVFLRSPAQQADLKNLLIEQRTKGSPMYHQWLRPGQFAARYGVSQHDLSQVAAWLQSQGFQVSAIPASADRIDFNGTASQVEVAFHTQLHRYLLHGVPGWANATDISVPQAIAGMTLGIAHLNTFRPQPHFARRPVHVVQQPATDALHPHYTVQVCTVNTTPCPSGDTATVNFLAPSDIHTIYDLDALYNGTITGKGQTMAVMGQTDITTYQSDIAHFRSLSGLNASNLPTQILVPNTGSAAVSPGDLEEADIDVEWSGAVAKDATILYITVGNNTQFGVFDSLQYAVQTALVNNNTQFVPVISISYGNCEQAFAGSTDVQTMEGYLQQANSQGQTVVAAAGDSGSADCDVTGQNSSGTYVGAVKGLAVDYPGSSQYVTAAGGTSFSGDVTNQSQYWSSTNNANNGSALSYIPETTWNDTPNLTDLSNIGSLSAGGGGASTLFSKPSWQAGNGVPKDSKRDVPDVSLAADPNHDGYVLCTEETNSAGTALTGTSSCAYPVGSGEVAYFDATGNGYLYGGTSIVAPQLAAMITLWNQKAGNTSGVGNANPIFYLNAQNTPGAFHDTTTGSNAVVCQQGSPDCVASSSGGYVMSCCNAGSGYDQATGLGSVDAAALAAIWPTVTATNTNFTLLANPASLTIPHGGSGTTKLVLSPSTGFTGTVTLTCSNLPANTTCSFAPSGSVVLTSGVATNVTLTVANTSTAGLFAPMKPFQRSWPMETAFASVLGVFLLGAGRKRRLFPPKMLAGFILLFGLVAATALTACSSGSSSTGGSGTGGGGGGSSTTSTITVTGTSTATSGSSTASTQIQLTIS